MLTHSSTSLVSAQSTRSLTERRITHIVSVCTEPIPAHHPQSGIRYLRVPVEDQPYEDLLIWMPHTCRFIDEALRTGGVVLVHGVHGLSRGATIMAAYRTIPVPHCLILQYPNPLTSCCTSNVVPARQRSHGNRHGQTKYGYIS